VRAPKEWRESLNLLREYLYNREQNADRNTDGRDYSDGISVEMRTLLLDMEEGPLLL
jgi:hypothetical protein